MNSSLTDALCAEEEHAPDPRDVLDGVARGLRRRRQRGAVLAAVLVLAVLAGSGAVVGALLRSPPAHVAAPFVAMPTPDAVYTTVCDWLPPDLTPAGPCRAAMASDGGPYLATSVTAAPDPAPSLDMTGWQRIEVNGRPGRLVSRPTRTIMLWQLPSGHWANLELGRGRPGAANAQPGIEQDARRIAAGLTERREPTLKPHVSLTYVPRGYRVDRVSTRGGNGGQQYETLRAITGEVRPLAPRQYGTEDGIVDEYPAYGADGSFVVTLMGPVNEWNVVGRDGWTRIADVQGHRTYTNAGRSSGFGSGSGTAPQQTGVRIVLLDYHGGDLVLDTFGDHPPGSLFSLAGGGPPFDELLKVAQGVRWTD